MMRGKAPGQKCQLLVKLGRGGVKGNLDHVPRLGQPFHHGGTQRRSVGRENLLGVRNRLVQIIEDVQDFWQQKHLPESRESHLLSQTREHR